MIRPLALSFALVLLGAALAACSPEVRDFSSGAGGSASSTGVTSGSGVGANGSTGVSSNSSVAVSSGTGMPQGAGDCDTDVECPQGKCVEVTPGGFRVCLNEPPEANTCSMSTEDQCCSSAACKVGSKCYLTSPGCVGPVVLPHNACLADQCQTDMDCMVSGDLNQICVAPGVFGNPVRSCFSAGCRLDTDCTEEPSGICAPVNNPCCATVSMACVYPSNGCRSDANCKNLFCVIEGSRAQCVDKPPICPG
jgi:hypothetical protein